MRTILPKNFSRARLLALICAAIPALSFSAAQASPYFGSSRFSREFVRYGMVRTERNLPMPNAEDEDARIESRGSRPTVSGRRAILRNGVAYAPSSAPENVKRAIWATNALRSKPYVWGGGHNSFYDRGYDCSGTVSFALHHAGVLATPMSSSDLTRYGQSGRGRWITIYTRSGHAFAVIAGLRLDTTGFNEREGPRWRGEAREPRGFSARHPVGL